jgi:uncharacterized SAM-binding protein YcdF (DUF218 family)
MSTSALVRPLLLHLRTIRLPLLVVAGLLIAAAPSALIASKIIGMLLMPAGVVWLGFLMLADRPGMSVLTRALVITVLIVHTLAGSAWLGAWLLGKLEAPYAALTPPTEKLDAICVLGGGSSARPDGDPQLGPAGDRLTTPVRLMLTGKASTLVASGLNVTDAGGSRSLARDTARIWMDLGVSEAAIILLEKPRNTREEVRAYRDLISQQGWQHVGVCSSAWHLRRVEAICRKEGLTVVPIPADFLSAPLPWSPLYAIPQARGFQNVQKALWEFLGAFGGG